MKALHTMLQRVESEHSSLEYVHSVRQALYFWCLPAVSLAGIVANALWLLFWRRSFVNAGRRTCTSMPSAQGDRERTAAAVGEATQIHGSVYRQTSEPPGPRRGRDRTRGWSRGGGRTPSLRPLGASFSIPLSRLESGPSFAAIEGAGARADEGSTVPVCSSIPSPTAAAAAAGAAAERRIATATAERKGINDGDGDGPVAVGVALETGRSESAAEEETRERSACALQLELYALMCIALLAVAAGESIFVHQLHTHPSLLHDALCRLWPLLYHLLLTFPPTILIPALFHKRMFYSNCESPMRSAGLSDFLRR